jgi:HTH-type transcriptional regulator / antitoxin HipB
MDYPVFFAPQLSKHLRSLRKARGLTQVQLAEKLGVVQSRIAAMESKPETMSVARLFEMLTALDVKLVLRDVRPEPSADREVPSSGPKGSW